MEIKTWRLATGNAQQKMDEDEQTANNEKLNFGKDKEKKKKGQP